MKSRTTKMSMSQRARDDHADLNQQLCKRAQARAAAKAAEQRELRDCKDKRFNSTKTQNQCSEKRSSLFPPVPPPTPALQHSESERTSSIFINPCTLECDCRPKKRAKSMSKQKLAMLEAVDREVALARLRATLLHPNKRKTATTKTASLTTKMMPMPGIPTVDASPSYVKPRNVSFAAKAQPVRKSKPASTSSVKPAKKRAPPTAPKTGHFTTEAMLAAIQSHAYSWPAAVQQPAADNRTSSSAHTPRSSPTKLKVKRNAKAKIVPKKLKAKSALVPAKSAVKCSQIKQNPTDNAPVSSYCKCHDAEASDEAAKDQFIAELMPWLHPQSYGHP